MNINKQIYNLIKKIFSIENSANKTHKRITILGIKIKIKNKKDCLKLLLENLNAKDDLICQLENKIKVLQEEKDCLLNNFSNFIPNKGNSLVQDAYLLNDTRREKNHLGCSLVYSNLNILCEKYGMNIFFSDSAYPSFDDDIKQYNNILKYSGIVIFNGEGTLHDDAGINMFEKCKLAKEMGKKVVLINTVWQNNKNTEKYLKYFDLISCRESLSYFELPENVKSKAMVVPDLTFYGRIKEYPQSDENKVLFTDSVIPKNTTLLKKLADNYNEKIYYMHNNGNKVSTYLEEKDIASLGKNSLIVTGRFHALTLGIKYQVPTIVLSSNTHKVEGLLKDAGLSFCLAKNEREITHLIDNIDSFRQSYFIKANQYYQNAQIRIEHLFKTISLGD